MRFDFSPLYRSAIGFDHLASFFDGAENHQQSYPPYNVELVSEDDYRITMAVAGFLEEELEITSEQNLLIISGRKNAEAEPAKYLYQGIGARGFERKFKLADHVQITGAELAHGLLHVNLKRVVPEAMKPRKISINGLRQVPELDKSTRKSA